MRTCRGSADGAAVFLVLMPDYVSQKLKRTGAWSGSFDLCVMTYDERFLRRKVIKTVHDETLLVDLPQTTSVNDRDAFVLTDGRLIEVIAADEELFEVTGDLVKLAWHIGNRHTPCQIEADRLLIQRDKVIGHMLEHLHATVTEVVEPFTPEGGAYGHGRTHGHSH